MSSQSPSANSCRIAFLEKWTPQNHLWGLNIGQNGIYLDRNNFSCCGGDGIVIDPKNKKDASFCGLSRRWNLMFSLMKQWKTSVRGEANPWIEMMDQEDSGHQSQKNICLEGFLKQHLDQWINSSRGSIFTSRTLKNAPKSLESNLIWVIASVLAWHFEIVVLVARVSDPVMPINYWQELLAKHHQARAIFLIEGTAELWNPARLEALEAVIAFASERQIPIWIQDLNQGASGQSPGADQPASKSRSFKSVIANRIDKQKHKPLIQWLSAQGKSRLSELCNLPEDEKQPSNIPDFL